MESTEREASKTYSPGKRLLLAAVGALSLLAPGFTTVLAQEEAPFSRLPDQTSQRANMPSIDARTPCYRTEEGATRLGLMLDTRNINAREHSEGLAMVIRRQGINPAIVHYDLVSSEAPGRVTFLDTYPDVGDMVSAYYAPGQSRGFLMSGIEVSIHPIVGTRDNRRLGRALAQTPPLNWNCPPAAR